VVLNHFDIEYYDYGAHLVYLKSPYSFEEDIEKRGVSAVYAGGEEIYALSFHPAYLSSMPQGPFIWTDPTFYPDFIVAIDWMWTYRQMADGIPDPRKDPRIVEALKKYGQFREGLHGEIVSIDFSSPEDVVVELELTNRDAGNYYYLDPGKMGMGLFHYFTNGLIMWDSATSRPVTHEMETIQPDPWDSFDMEWMSLLEGGSSVTLTIAYDQFEAVQQGSYDAFFTFPGMHNHVDRDDLEQVDGRLWLGEIEMSSKVVID
jgi:hypothetical protein